MCLFVQSHYVIILFLAITFSSSVFLKAEHVESKKIQFLESIATYAHELGNGVHEVGHAISENFYNLVDYVQDVFHISHHGAPKFKYDVTLVGFVNFADGIGRHPILFKECLGSNIKMNFLSTRDISAEVEDAQLGLPRLDPANKKDVGAVAILLDILADKELNIYKKVPDSHIKIAYTMFESTEIPNNWAQILNNKFDMAVVPDQFLVDVYKNCGVQIPIFVLPLPLMLKKFFELELQTQAHKPFVFGMSGGFWKRKNHIRVLDAFAREFGNSKKVKLRLHGRFGEEAIIKELSDKIAEYGLTNVELIVKPYNWDEYLEFFKSLDCYVFLSMGEGFSVTPREALACGKPCILTNNTAQTTICNSGSVSVVRSEILVPAIYDCHYDNFATRDLKLENLKRFLQISSFEVLDNISIDDEDDFLLKSGNIGYQFDCTLRDARKAMREVYKHYDEYLEKASYGREWVKSYLQENLSSKYVSLVKPESIVLGKQNIIGDNFLVTDSKKLYEKYKYILDNQ
ncbi:MAG: glycosyltransferase [Candidatus Babeliales bacterium]